MDEHCCNMRPPKRSKLPPERQRWTRCRRNADLLVSLHQASDHQLVGSGWFALPLCNRCFDENREAR